MKSVMVSMPTNCCLAESQRGQALTPVSTMAKKARFTSSLVSSTTKEHTVCLYLQHETLPGCQLCAGSGQFYSSHINHTWVWKNTVLGIYFLPHLFWLYRYLLSTYKIVTGTSKIKYLQIVPYHKADFPLGQLNSKSHFKENPLPLLCGQLWSWQKNKRTKQRRVGRALTALSRSLVIRTWTLRDY